MSIEFQEWPKVPRLNRDIIITEKIDGTNGAIIVDEVKPDGPGWDDFNHRAVLIDGTYYLVAAQSRKRVITRDADNFGFAKWVYENAEELARILGPGRHFGEWWGSGIQRGYGCNPGERYFSLFNVKRWEDKYDQETWPAGLSIVPVLYRGPFSERKVKASLRFLEIFGSMAYGDFRQPEGIVVYHTAANEMFKVTLENDEAPKSAVALAA